MNERVIESEWERYATFSNKSEYKQSNASERASKHAKVSVSINKREIRFRFISSCNAMPTSQQ